MNKIAFFVEGLTELLFLKKLIKEIVNDSKFVLRTQKMRGGGRSLVRIEVLEEDHEIQTTECLILITECGGDSSVKSYILEQRQSLMKSGYKKVIGLVDLYPKEKNALSLYKRGLRYGVPQVPLEIDFIIAVMEIEAWFIAEKNHFPHIDLSINDDVIANSLGLSSIDDFIAEDIPHPAAALNDIYQTAGKAYKKKASTIERTIQTLDYSRLYLEMPDTISSLRELIDVINNDIIST